MVHKNKEDRAKYMREYRKRLKEDISLSGDDLEARLEEYKSQGLDKNDLFMDTIYNLAMQGKNAKYAELWWRMTKPEPDQDAGKTEWTAEMHINFGIALNKVVRQTLREKGYGYAYTREEINCILQWAKDEGYIEDFNLPRDLPLKWVGIQNDADKFYQEVQEGKHGLPTPKDLDSIVNPKVNG